ncbi:putative alpha-1,2-mannosidase [Lentisphaera araneosa HTCC2155]|uniref:Putative alpha-1,2-mannosidase n=1 Tax=Lentisphaera araneosa HTCC2155 TaxID=313628 RepID=A6DPU8_9BACT|nr:FN3 associated domain-containing protein [Lentisphaera araneosa]EDM26393.1 putative alpha-1,2-mannosidase [Lentisphaera araneosa HTCC2155]
MKKGLLNLALFGALISTASAQITLNGNTDHSEQGWEKYGKQELSIAEGVVGINDQSTEDTASLSHPIDPALQSLIRKHGFELAFTSRVSDANPSGTGIELHVAKAVRLVLGLNSYQNKQNIYFWDPVAKKQRSHQIDSEDFVHYRVVWTPDADGGKVSVFTNGEEVISQSHAIKLQGSASSIKIGGLRAGKARTGKLELRKLTLKPLGGNYEVMLKASKPTVKTAKLNKQAFAREFLDGLYSSFEEMHFNGLRGNKDYQKLIKLKNDGDYDKALTAFRDYFLTKLRNPQSFGLTTADLSVYSNGNTGLGAWAGPQFDVRSEPASILKLADQILAGKLAGRDIGKPGTVNWNYPHKKGAVLDYMSVPDRGLYDFSAFSPLVQAYLISGNRDYVEQYMAYLSDWTDNADYLINQHPCKIPHSTKNDPTRAFMRLFAAIVNTPNSDELIEPELFARVIDKLLKYTYSQMAYLRSNTHNWTPSMAIVIKALLFNEFKISRSLFREGVRRNVEDNAVTQNLRDGTENQQCPWYNDNYLQVYQFLRLIEARSNLPIWRENLWLKEWRTNPRRQNDIREHLMARINYTIKNRTPQNQWPSPWRGGDKRHMHLTETRIAMSPEAFNEPENAKIYQAMTNPGSGVRPDLKANWFPYGGYNTIWEGWEKDSAYGALFCSPVPGAYGAFRSRSNNNVFGLSAFGADLLIDDTVGHYMYPSSPVQVDGKDQYFHKGIHRVKPPSSHKSYQVKAWLEPSDFRWHSSEKFNLMEGVYQGNWYSDAKVKHQRLVQYIRNTPIWIVTDRMHSLDNKPHEYKQIWHIPTKPSKYAAYANEDIVVDAKNNKITATGKGETNETGTMIKQPSFSLYTFSNEQLKYDSKLLANNPKNHYQICARKEVYLRWKGTDSSQLVSLLIPRQQGVSEAEVFSELKMIKNVDSTGFSGKLADGRIVEYLSSADDTVELSLSNVVANAKSLLVVRTDNGSVNLVVLDCKALSVNGKLIALKEKNVEVSVSDDKTEIINIYRPIKPVEIFPQRNVFMDSLEVSLQSETRDVEIRYTLDNSEPTPQSTLYTVPFTIKATTTVRARAYRKGVKNNPVVLSGTYATVVSKAHFDKKTAVEPQADGGTTVGLKCSYYEGQWQQLWMNLNALKPKRTGIAKDVFDLSLIPESNPKLTTAEAPRQKYYALKYEGYIEVPEDGVYTFHAPSEYIYPNVDQGYELNVSVGNRMLPFGWNSTRKSGLNLWYPATSLHAYGNWSIALKKGLHPVKVTYADWRTNASELLNEPNTNKYIWDGVKPKLLFSGPGLNKQAIPAEWLKHK